MNYLKQPRVRSVAYLRFVASFPCFACGVEGFSQAAHANVGKGMSLKTSDLETFPLCAAHWGLPGCHWQHDNMVDMTRDERRELEAKYVERMQAIARQHGRKELKEAA